MEMISKAIVDGTQQAILEKLEEGARGGGKSTAREDKIKAEYGDRAVKVEPYAANRKQRKAQAAAKRKAAKRKARSK